MVLDFLLHLYENFRKSKTKVESNKPNQRKYDFDAGLTGNKKVDMKSGIGVKNISSRIEKNSRDER